MIELSEKNNNLRANLLNEIDTWLQQELQIVVSVFLLRY